MEFQLILSLIFQYTFLTAFGQESHVSYLAVPYSLSLMKHTACTGRGYALYDLECILNTDRHENRKHSLAHWLNARLTGDALGPAWPRKAHCQTDMLPASSESGQEGTAHLRIWHRVPRFEWHPWGEPKTWDMSLNQSISTFLTREWGTLFHSWLMSAEVIVWM